MQPQDKNSLKPSLDSFPENTFLALREKDNKKNNSVTKSLPPLVSCQLSLPTTQMVQAYR